MPLASVLREGETGLREGETDSREGETGSREEETDSSGRESALLVHVLRKGETGSSR